MKIENNALTSAISAEDFQEIILTKIEDFNKL